MEMKRMVLQELLSRYGNVSMASRLSGYARRSYYYRPRQHIIRNPRIDLVMLESIEREALMHPSYGVRRVTALLKKSGLSVNRKKVYRLMKLANLIKRRSVRKYQARRRTVTIPVRPNHVWEQDITYVFCGRDGWCFLFNIIDCYTREWLAYTFSKECGTDEALRALDSAVLERFPDGAIPEGLTVRNDGGPQYTSDRFIQALSIFRIEHEVTGKNRPDEDAYIEAFHRWLKEDYIWQHEFETFNEADGMMKQFFIDYNWNRPHSSLNYMTPKEFYRSNGGND